MNPDPQENQPQPGQVYTPGQTQPEQTPVVQPEPAVSQPTDPPVAQVPDSGRAPAANLQPEETDKPLLAWQASEYIHHDKRFGWHFLFFVALAGGIAGAVLTHQWLTIGVLTLMGVALVVYANKRPRVLNYALGERGITIDTKFYDYDSFKSFGVIQDLAWHLIDLEPMRRFMPRLNILFEDTNRDQIIDLLSQRLPREDRQPDLVERAARYLRF
jgi:hypothetical protein